MTKPIIQYQCGKWYCHIRALLATRIGVGNTMESAYDNWRQQTDPTYGRAEEHLRILNILRKVGP